MCTVRSVWWIIRSSWVTTTAAVPRRFISARMSSITCSPILVSSAEGGARRLLHLDLHPFNVLVDEDGEPTGVIDWANAAGGDPELDRARTWSILTLDPSVRPLRENPGWGTLTDHWLPAG